MADDCNTRPGAARKPTDPLDGAGRFLCQESREGFLPRRGVIQLTLDGAHSLDDFLRQSLDFLPEQATELHIDVGHDCHSPPAPVCRPERPVLQGRQRRSRRPVGQIYVDTAAGTLLDGVRDAIAKLESTQVARNGILIIWDGDSLGSYDRNAVRALVAASDAPVFVLSRAGGASRQAGPDETELSGGELLDALSRRTGGLHLSLDQGIRAGVALANFYVLLADHAAQAGESSLEVEFNPPLGVPRGLSLSYRAGLAKSPANP